MRKIRHYVIELASRKKGFYRVFVFVKRDVTTKQNGEDSINTNPCVKYLSMQNGFIANYTFIPFMTRVFDIEKYVMQVKPFV